jgi:hypothetical protein
MTQESELYEFWEAPALYCGRSWAGEEQACPDCAGAPFHLTERRGRSTSLLWAIEEGLWEEVGGEPGVVVRSTAENRCCYVSTDRTTPDNRPWIAPYYASCLGIRLPAERRAGINTFYDVINFFTYHPQSGRQIDLPPPSCLVPIQHHYRRRHTVVLALPAPTNPDPPQVSRVQRIDDRP